MLDDRNLQNAERTLARVFGEDELQLQLVLNGVNKTLSGKCPKGEFFLRLSPERLHPQQQLKHEARLLTFIADHSPSLAARPFPDARHAGTAFAWDDQPYFGIATTVAPGVPYDESAGQLKRFGQALARLHGVPVSGEIDLGDAVADVAPFHGGDGRLADQISLVSASAADWADRGRATTSGRRSIRHGDAWPGNGRFNASAVTLFDFEHTSIGDPVADFANVAWWLTGAQQPSETKAELWGAFLDGYREHSDVSCLDLSGLPYHVLLVELRSLVFLRDFIQLLPEVVHSIEAGTQRLVEVWRDRPMAENGRMSNGW